MAGIWEEPSGADEHPVAEGTEHDAFVEHYEAQPIDRQTNGPQLFYGLRYHTHIVKPGDIENLSRPGWILAVGAGGEDSHLHPRYSQGPSPPGCRAGRARRLRVRAHRLPG